MQAERDIRFSGVDPSFEFERAPDTTDEPDAGIGARVWDAEHGIEDAILDAGDIQARVGAVEPGGGSSWSVHWPS